MFVQDFFYFRNSVHEVKEVVVATDDIQKRQDVLNRLTQGHKKT